jgi:uncharacterized protein (DUF1778 family)
MYGLLTYDEYVLFNHWVSTVMTTESTTNSAGSRKERLEARISAEQKEMLVRAAALQGRTLTEFIVQNLQEAARQAILEHERLELSAQDREVFCQALLNPPAPNDRLRRAAAQYWEALEQTEQTE